jgi:hypothetical protein
MNHLITSNHKCIYNIFIGPNCRCLNSQLHILSHELILRNSAHKLLKLNIYIYYSKIMTHSTKPHTAYFFIISLSIIKCPLLPLTCLTAISDHNTNIWSHTFRSQHSPVAHEALAYSIHVDALQQGLSQWPFIPQSHCSPASTNPFPHTGLSNRLAERQIWSWQFNFILSFNDRSMTSVNSSNSKHFYCKILI